MNPARHLLIEFVLDKSGDEPARKRVALYRSLAAELPEASEDFGTLTTMADELEQIEAAHAQLLIKFRRDADIDGKNL